jgi:hypothetical protein
LPVDECFRYSESGTNCRDNARGGGLPVHTPRRGVKAYPFAIRA